MLGGYCYDNNMFKMMTNINGLSTDDLINYYIYVLTKINE